MTVGIILAGGRSRRMGADKASVELDGVPLIERVAAALSASASSVLIVAESAGEYYVPGTLCIGDLYPGEGPVGGILTGMKHSAADAYMVAACDMPCIQPGLPALLLHRLESNPECDAAVPIIGREPEPLCAVYRSSAGPKLESYLQAGGRSARSALRQLTIVEIEEQEIRAIDPHLVSFTNINTPEELSSARNQS